MKSLGSLIDALGSESLIGNSPSECKIQFLNKVHNGAQKLLSVGQACGQKAAPSTMIKFAIICGTMFGPRAANWPQQDIYKTGCERMVRVGTE
jgi:hypothetical protein